MNRGHAILSEDGAREQILVLGLSSTPQNPPGARQRGDAGGASKVQRLLLRARGANRGPPIGLLARNLGPVVYTLPSERPSGPRDDPLVEGQPCSSPRFLRRLRVPAMAGHPRAHLGHDVLPGVPDFEPISLPVFPDLPLQRLPAGATDDGAIPFVKLVTEGWVKIRIELLRHAV